MLEPLKGLIGSKTQKQVDDLQALITTAKEERSALSAMLTHIPTRSAELMQMGKTLEQVEGKASAASGKLDAVAMRMEAMEHRVKTFDGMEKRVQALVYTVTSMQQAAEMLIDPEGDFQKHRQQVQQLSSQAPKTQASVDALEELGTQLHKGQAEMKQAVERASTLQEELDNVRGTAGQLAQDIAEVRVSSREAREDSTSAVETVKDLEKRLGSLQELSKATDEKIRSLNALWPSTSLRRPRRWKARSTRSIARLWKRTA